MFLCLKTHAKSSSSENFDVSGVDGAASKALGKIGDFNHQKAGCHLFYVSR